MKEKLQEYALLAEIISAVCIVLSLIFVGLQVRQGSEETAANTAAIQGSVRQAMMEADKDLLLFAAEHPEIETGLEADLAYQVAYIRTRHHYWKQYEAGLLDAETYYSFMVPLLQNPATKQRIEGMVTAGILPVAFINEINRLAEEVPFEPQPLSIPMQ